MYCDKCGTPFAAGAQYCAVCGKEILGGTTRPAATTGPGAGYPATSARATGDGRVARNINLLAALWLANGVLRLIEVSWLMMFRRLLFEHGWGWWRPGGFPFSFGPFVWGGLLFGGVTLAAFGVIHLLLAWSLFERQPWARVFAIVIALLALLRFPFGTALGIYTLWVLMPEASGREYDAMTRMGAPVSVAR